MRALALACCLIMGAVPGFARADDHSATTSVGSGMAAGDAGAEQNSISPTTWSLISAGVVASVAGLAVALNSGGNGHHGTTTTTTTTTTSTH